MVDQHYCYNVRMTHPLQSKEWGEVRKKMGIDVVRIDTFQLSFHKIPRTSFTVGYLPRSPIPEPDIIDEIIQESKKRNAIFVKCEPNVYKRDIENANKLDPRLRPAQHSLFPQWTQILDLTETEKELLDNMKPKMRYNIGLAARKGIVVREMTNEEGFAIFTDLYFQTTKRQQYKGHNREYHKIIFETLKDKISHILVAFYKNTPLAAYHLFVYDNVLYYPYGGSSPEHKEVMAPHLLMWETIRFGKKKGCRLFDMWGSLPPDYDRNADWGGFTRFKEGFGAEFKEFIGSFDLVNNSFTYSAFNMAQTFRKKWLHLI